LTSLILDECDSLIEIPDVSCLSNLENLSFARCQNLLTIHRSVGLLEMLKILDALNYQELKSFPPLKLTSLEQFEVSYCVSLGSEFKVIPECIEKCRFLTTLTLDYCGGLQEIRGIPPNLKHFSTLHDPALTSSSISMLLNQVVFFMFSIWSLTEYFDVTKLDELFMTNRNCMRLETPTLVCQE